MHMQIRLPNLFLVFITVIIIITTIPFRITHSLKKFLCCYIHGSVVQRQRRFHMRWCSAKGVSNNNE